MVGSESMEREGETFLSILMTLVLGLGGTRLTLEVILQMLMDFYLMPISTYQGGDSTRGETISKTTEGGMATHHANASCS